MTLSVQFITMISMVLSGFYLGIIQQTFRRLTTYWRDNAFLTYFLEIGFWLTQAGVIFYVLYHVNAGEVRLYVLLACLLGFSIYQVFAKKPYIRMLEVIIRIVSSIYHFIRRLFDKLLLSPLKWIITLIYRMIKTIFGWIITLLLFLLNVILAPFIWIGKGIYKLIPDSFKKFLKKIAGFYSKIKNICYRWLQLFRRR